jgi:glutamate synthase (NADPH/NADH) small chain
MEEALALGRGEQDFSVTTTCFTGEGQVAAVQVARADGAPPFGPVPGTDFEIPADLVLLAMGFLHPEPALLEEFGVATDARGNAKAPAYETSEPGIFAAGDARRGQSLIVWAINEGRQCARIVERHLAALPSGARA